MEIDINNTKIAQNALNRKIREKFHLPAVDARQYSALSFAYIGDGIFDLIVRSIFLDQAHRTPQKLHIKTSRIVNASSQARMMKAIKPYLTDAEQDVYRRGANAKQHTMAKNASRKAYHEATGFEAVLGYLYLTEQEERLLHLIEIGLSDGDFLGGDSGKSQDVHQNNV